MLYLVSIEPMYSQSVGNYYYLCDSTDKVEFFRQVLREFGRQCYAETDDDVDEESEYTGYEFFESVYVFEGDDERRLREVKAPKDPTIPALSTSVTTEATTGDHIAHIDGACSDTDQGTRECESQTTTALVSTVVINATDSGKSESPSIINNTVTSEQEEEKADEGIFRGRRVLKADYQDFYWLKQRRSRIEYEMREGARYDYYDFETDDLPLLGHVMDNVQGLSDIPLMEFIKDNVPNM